MKMLISDQSNGRQDVSELAKNANFFSEKSLTKLQCCEKLLSSACIAEVTRRCRQKVEQFACCPFCNKRMVRKFKKCPITTHVQWFGHPYESNYGDRCISRVTRAKE